MGKSARIEEIFEKCYASRASEKTTSMHLHIAAYLLEKQGLDDFTAYADPISLKHLNDAYFIDVIRYKEYHLKPSKTIAKSALSEQWALDLHSEGENGSRINKPKVSALTVKWILKYRPITVMIDDGKDISSINHETQRVASFVNEDFALSHALTLLEIPDSKINPRLAEDFLYHLKYRSFDERHFFMLFDLIR